MPVNIDKRALNYNLAVIMIVRFQSIAPYKTVFHFELDDANSLRTVEVR